MLITFHTPKYVSETGTQIVVESRECRQHGLSNAQEPTLPTSITGCVAPISSGFPFAASNLNGDC